ncbi:MAG: regulatory protein MerR [Pseudonocardiales bacterium]|nr:regulatory protein MerR [Pseudonocardiales bacterium]
MTSTEPADFSEGIAISEVSRQLGVPVATLRSWELRYGIPPSVRSAGRHRRYDTEQMHTLRLMRDELARGKRASAAAASVRAQLGLAGPARVLVDEFLAASLARDPQQLHGVLDRARDEFGLGSCIDDVLMPAMRQIGEWWAVGRCDQAEEHLTSESAHSWLNATNAFAPPPQNLQPVTLACGPADQHTLGIESLALLLRYEHRACRVLGARVSPTSLLVAARAAGAVGVVLVSHLSTTRTRALESIRTIDEAGLEVFYAGNAFTDARARSGVPGLYLGTNLAQAAVLVERRLAST